MEVTVYMKQNFSVTRLKTALDSIGVPKKESSSFVNLRTKLLSPISTMYYMQRTMFHVRLP